MSEQADAAQGRTDNDGVNVANTIEVHPDLPPGNVPGSSRPNVSLPDFAGNLTGSARMGVNFDQILGIPVKVEIVIGSAVMPVSNIMKLGRGAVVALDRRVGDPVDVVVNGRIIARGEIVVLENDNSRIGVSLTEIVGAPASSDTQSSGNR